MATAKMKPSISDRTQHFVIIEVDDRPVEQVLTATAGDAEALAAAVVDAAAGRHTIVLPIGQVAATFEIVGHVVLDFASVGRTAVRVESRSMQFASMGIKK